MYTLLLVRFWFLVLFSMQDIVHMYFDLMSIMTKYGHFIILKMAKIHDCKPFQESRVYFKHYAADCLPSI